MQIINDLKTLIDEKTAITIGKFDGLHAGHQVLIKNIKEQKKLKSLLISLELGSGNFLTSREEKIYLLTQMGLDYAAFYPFNNELRNLSAQYFMEEILLKSLNMAYLSVGEDFCFGRGRQADITFLKDMANKYKFILDISKKIIIDGKHVSSTYIREQIKEGNLSLANSFLKRDYIIAGKVASGDKLARRYNLSTMNIYPDKRKELPPYGVYAAHVILDKKIYKAVVNIGVRPTVSEDNKVSIETHVINKEFNKQAYGDFLIINLYKQIRAEEKFDSTDALFKQIAKDKQEAGEMLKG